MKPEDSPSQGGRAGSGDWACRAGTQLLVIIISGARRGGAQAETKAGCRGVRVLVQKTGLETLSPLWCQPVAPAFP